MKAAFPLSQGVKHDSEASQPRELLTGSNAGHAHGDEQMIGWTTWSSVVPGGTVECPTSALGSAMEAGRAARLH